MTYRHLTTDELVLIASYYRQTEKVSFVARQMNRSRQTIYHVYHALDKGLFLLDYYQRYKINKKKCGRHPISLPDDQNTFKRVLHKSGLLM